MNINNYFIEMQEKIINSITDDLDKEYVVCSEYIADYDGTYIGSMTNNGYGDTALVRKIGEDPINFPEFNSFESAVDYFEKSGRGYKVYHLREGMKTIIREHQMVYEEGYSSLEFYKLYCEYWDSLCDYAKKFTSPEEMSANLLELADTMNKAVSIFESTKD